MAISGYQIGSIFRGSGGYRNQHIVSRSGLFILYPIVEIANIWDAAAILFDESIMR
jgi:hypothetical protein